MTGEREPVSAPPAPKGAGPWVWVVLLGVVLLGFWATVFVVVPRQKRYFDEFGLMLPWATKRVIDFGYVFRTGWLAFVPASVVAFGGFLALTKTRVLPPVTARRVAQLATILLLALLVVTGVALGLPMLKLAEGLAK